MSKNWEDRRRYKIRDFEYLPIRKIHLGKGFKWYPHWTLKSALPDVEVEIDPDNPYIKISDDGHMV